MDEGIVTGEGVLLDTRPTSFLSRVVAALIDLTALGIVLVVTVLVLGGSSFAPSEALSRVLFVAALATVMVVLPTMVDTLTRGRSLGKLVVGIRVVRDDGGPIRLRQAFVRALTGVFELWLTVGSVALICSIVQPQGKRVGDLLAGTYAVRVRGKTAARTPVMMPPHLAGWAAGADVRRLPDGLALSVRQFLTRTSTLHPQSRASLGTDLAVEVQRFVAPAPPPGTHPELFLAAVLAERRRREHLSAEAGRQRAAQESVLMQRLPHGVPDPVD